MSREPLKYIIKWEGISEPERFVFPHLDAFWHHLRELFIRQQRMPEWIIRTYD